MFKKGRKNLMISKLTFNFAAKYDVSKFNIPLRAGTD